jgi:hypothetical protein
MPILTWRHYADHRVAPLCRSPNGSIWAITNNADMVSRERLDELIAGATRE